MRKIFLVMSIVLLAGLSTIAAPAPRAGHHHGPQHRGPHLVGHVAGVHVDRVGGHRHRH